MENKDPELTYEELTALCRKQEEYIKELETKLRGTSSDDEKRCPSHQCETPYELTYEELQNVFERKVNELRRCDEMLSAVMEALRISNNRLHEEIESANYYKEQYYKIKKQEGQ